MKTFRISRWSAIGLMLTALLCSALPAEARESRGRRPPSQRHRSEMHSHRSQGRGHHAHYNPQRHPPRHDRSGGFAAGLLVGHILTAPRPTVQVVHCAPVEVCYPAPPQPIIVNTGCGRRLYQPTYGHIAFIQAWNGWQWTTIGTHPSLR
ncbi:MAG: hypothetical protein EOM20_03950 [Spartobacteria bacterium]|nr:hypothetical protein [Spartobacteria bacterium]